MVWFFFHMLLAVGDQDMQAAGVAKVAVEEAYTWRSRDGQGGPGRSWQTSMRSIIVAQA